MKKFLCVILALTMALSLAACGKSGGDTSAPEGGDGKLLIGLPMSPNCTDINDNYMTKYLEEKLGIDLEFMEFSSNNTERAQQLATMVAAGEELPPNVRGITADCGFSSPAEILGHIIRRDFHLPPKLVLPLMEVWARFLGGFSFYECDSRETLSRSKTPILFIHGKADDFVPSCMSEFGFAACASEKEILLVDDAGHGRSYLYEPERLRNALTDFFKRNLSEEYTL